ncbi:MAG TPA: hypothetical protein VHU80_03585 [Polyangiaceae bacterium]|jgi:hypothetical protein|nr:hypothetical protein [Polyangiaceae bacterium]
MRTDPRAGDEAGHTVIERPPPGPARGRYPAPAWAVLALGAVLVFGALAYFGWRVRGRIRR